MSILYQPLPCCLVPVGLLPNVGLLPGGFCFFWDPMGDPTMTLTRREGS